MQLFRCDFREYDLVPLACVATSLLIVPLGGVPGLVAFSGDFLLLAYLLGLMRFVTILAASVLSILALVLVMR